HPGTAPAHRRDDPGPRQQVLAPAAFQPQGYERPPAASSRQRAPDPFRPQGRGFPGALPPSQRRATDDAPRLMRSFLALSLLTLSLAGCAAFQGAPMTSPD